jgi:hypothetical protein
VLAQFGAVLKKEGDRVKSSLMPPTICFADFNGRGMLFLEAQRKEERYNST